MVDHVQSHIIIIITTNFFSLFSLWLCHQIVIDSLKPTTTMRPPFKKWFDLGHSKLNVFIVWYLICYLIKIIITRHYYNSYQI